MYAAVETRGMKNTFRQRLSEDDKQALVDLLNALEIFRETRRDMPLQHVIAYLLVAIEEGLGPTEYGAKVGVQQPVMSRTLLDIGDRNRHREAGFGWITQRPDPMHLSRNQSMLTDTGVALANRVIRTLRRVRRRD